MAVDPKGSAFAFTESNGSPAEHWFDLRENVNAALAEKIKLDCKKCQGGGCEPFSKKAGKPLIMISGFPCAPYSLQRGDRNLTQWLGATKTLYPPRIKIAPSLNSYTYSAAGEKMSTKDIVFCKQLLAPSE